MPLSPDYPNIYSAAGQIRSPKFISLGIRPYFDLQSDRVR
jgi:hypothetical protein